MSLLVFGINHKTAPVKVREKVAIAAEDMHPALKDLKKAENVREALILSTCNRTEVYCHLLGNDYLQTIPWLLRHQRLQPEVYQPYLFSYPDESAVTHLLRVASGLDSLVLGEPQILGQIKSAYHDALAAGTIGKLLGKLFQYSFSVAKQVRTDTAIGNSPVSIAFAAVRLAQQIFGELDELSALLIGAGDTIELAARHLCDNRIGRVVIANRTLQRAQALAHELTPGANATAIALADIPKHLADADIVVTSTGSQLPILGKGAVEQALKVRKHRPMFLVDIAVPRDIEPQVGELQDVYLYTVDDMDTVIAENQRSRRQAAHQANDIIATQAHHFMHWWQSQDAVPTIQDLRAKAGQLRQQALDKAKRQLARGDTPEQVLEQLATALTNKLTHAPSAHLRQASAQGHNKVIKAARDLFNLDE